MVCCHHYQLLEGCDETFRVDGQSLVFGPGCLAEAGAHAASLGLKRVGLYTDKGLIASDHVDKVRKSLEAAGIDIAFYDDIVLINCCESVRAGVKVDDEKQSRAQKETEGEEFCEQSSHSHHRKCGREARITDEALVGLGR